MKRLYFFKCYIGLAFNIDFRRRLINFYFQEGDNVETIIKNLSFTAIVFNIENLNCIVFNVVNPVLNVLPGHPGHHKVVGHVVRGGDRLLLLV
jgi:hypothetical protein